MISVKVKIGRSWYNGTAQKGKIEGPYFIRYEINNKHTCGWFEKKDIKFLESPVSGNPYHEYRKTKNVKIECKCGYWTVIENRPVFGKCPECMAEKWAILKEVGTW